MFDVFKQWKASTRFIAAAVTVAVVAAAVGGAAVWHEQATKSPPVSLTSLRPVGTPTAAEKSAVFERIWGLFNQSYPSFQLKVVDWHTEKAIYEPKAVAAPTWPRFFAVVEQMIGTLHDDHTWLQGAPLPPTYAPALATKVVDNQVTVLIAPGSPELHPGDVILGVDGHPLTDLMNGVDPSTEQVSDWFRPVAEQASNVFVETTPKVERFTVLNHSTDAVEQVSVQAYTEAKVQQLSMAYLKSHPGYQYLSTSNHIQVRSLGKGILYIGIHLMTTDLQQQLQPYMGEIEKASGLIIDIRNNPGGNSGPSSWFAEHFFTHMTVPMEYRAKGDPWMPDEELALSPHIKAPTAVLINGSDFSSAEMFITEMESAKQVHTFGSRTAGADGNPTIFPVMKGVEVAVPQDQRRVTSTGDLIEGVGIAPETYVEPTYPDFMKMIDAMEHDTDPEKYDTVLQTALAWVKDQQAHK